MFAVSPDPALKYIRTEQVRQILRSSLSVETYRRKDTQMRHFIEQFYKGYYPVSFLKGCYYFQGIMKSTAMRRSSLWTMTSQSTVDQDIFLHSNLFLIPILSPKKLSCFSTYEDAALIGYSGQNVTKKRIALAHVSGMRPFSKIFSSSFIVHRTQSELGVFSRKKDRFALNSQAIDHAKDASSMPKDGKVPVEVWDKSATPDEVRQHVSYL